MKITVSVADVYHSLSGSVCANNLEHAVNAEVKNRFIKGGILFYDKPGLYPIPPAKTTFEKSCEGLRIITIRQDRL